MSHSVFQTAQIMPINTQIIPTTRTLSAKPLFPPYNPVFRSPVTLLFPVKVRKGLVVNASSSSPVVDGDSIAGLERCFRESPPYDSPSSSSSAMYAPVMKGEYGAFGAVTLEKSKLDTSQKQTKSSPEVEVVL